MKLTLLLLSVLTVMAAATIVSSLPEMAQVFKHTGSSDLLSKLVLSLPALFIALSAPLAGRYIDRHGRLKLLYAGLVLYTISGSSGLYLDNIYHIIIGRAFLGISIGIITTITITLIGDYFEGDKRKDFIGYQSAFIGVGGVIFLIAGGVMADVSWRLPFAIYILSLPLIPLCLLFLKEPIVRLESTMTVQIQTSSLVRIIFATALVFMVLFYILPTQLPFYLHQLGIEKSSLSGIAMAVHGLGVVIAALLYPRLKKRVQFRHVYALAFLLIAIGYVVIGKTSEYTIILSAMFVAGTGFGLFLPNTNHWIIELIRTDVRGRIMGILTTFIFLGQFLSPIIFEPFIRWFDLSSLFFFASGIMIVISMSFMRLGKSLT